MSKTLDNVRILNVAKVQGTTQSTSASTGALIVDGGIGIAKNLNVDGNINDITPTEFGYLDGVTSNIQTQLSGKASTSHTHAASDVTSGTFADARIASSNVTQHEASITIGNLSGAPTGAVVGTTDTQTLSNKTFSDAVNIDDTTQSSSVSTGALIVDGGIGAAKNLNIGGTSNLIGQVTLGTGGTAYSFPTTVGSTGQILEVNGSGDLQFATNSGSGTSAPSITLAACPMVAGGQGGNTLANSEDGGLTWTGLGTSVFSSLGRDVKFNGTDLYVAGGEGTLNTMAYSTDGETFIGLGKGIFSVRCYETAYSSVLDRWVAVGTGTNNTIAYSDDGITWVGLGTSTFSTSGVAVAYNGVDRFVAVGAGTNTIAYSTDGITWNATTNGNSIITTTGNGVVYVTSASRWVAVGQGTNSIAYSDDNGDNWTGVGTSTFSTQGFAIAYNGFSRLVAVGQGTNSIAYSDDDGANWTGDGTSTFSTRGFGVVYNAVDARWTVGGQGTNSQAYSTDGASWTGLGTTVFSTAAYGVTSCDRLPQSTPVFPIVAFGKDTTSGASNIVYSDDGGITTYTNIDSANTFDFSVQGFGGASNGAHFWVGCGQDPDNTLAYSYNGIVWFGAGASVFNARARAVAVNTGTGRWVAAGEGTTNTLAYSDNGTTWTGLAKTVFDVAGLGVAYDGGINSRWVAVGIGNTNTIAYSDDQGLTWTGVGKSIFSTAGRAVAHNGTDTWVAVGEGTNTIAYSSDGISWTGVGTSVFSTRGNAVAYGYDDGRWVAGGQGTNTLALSNTGTTWFGLGTSVFSTLCNSVAYDTKTSNWVAGGTGTNKLAYSPTGAVFTGIGVGNFATDKPNGLVSYESLPPPLRTDPPPLFIYSPKSGSAIQTSTTGISSYTTAPASLGGGDWGYNATDQRWLTVVSSVPYWSDDNFITINSGSSMSGGGTVWSNCAYNHTTGEWFVFSNTLISPSIFRSLDNGETWALYTSNPNGYSPISNLRLAVSENNALFVTGHEQNTIYYTTSASPASLQFTQLNPGNPSVAPTSVVYSKTDNHFHVTFSNSTTVSRYSELVIGSTGIGPLSATPYICIASDSATVMFDGNGNVYRYVHGGSTTPTLVDSTTYAAGQSAAIAYSTQLNRFVIWVSNTTTQIYSDDDGITWNTWTSSSIGGLGVGDLQTSSELPI